VHEILAEEVPQEDALEATETATTDSSRKRKQSDRKRGDRGLNEWPDKTYRVTEVSLKGQPLALAETLPKFRSALGFLGTILT
jgi:hypothetical protein